MTQRDDIATRWN